MTEGTEIGRNRTFDYRILKGPKVVPCYVALIASSNGFHGLTSAAKGSDRFFRQESWVLNRFLGQ